MQTKDYVRIKPAAKLLGGTIPIALQSCGAIGLVTLYFDENAVYVSFAYRLTGETSWRFDATQLEVIDPATLQ